MRHTLLPLNKRKALRRDYFIRLIIIFSLLVSTALLVGIVSLFPPYIYVIDLEKKENETANAIKASEENQNREVIESELRSDAKLLARLSSGQDVFKASVALKTIVSERNVVKIDYISFSSVGTSSVVMTVKGVSPTRDELLAYKGRLQSAFNEAKVDLPISELAKSKNLEFSLKITFKTI